MQAFKCIIGYEDIKEEAWKIAQEDSNILILGETGVGKTLFAQSIHKAGRRKGSPFVVVDCPAISSSLFESKLFGHNKGAYTDAKEDRTGLLEEAEGGTVFMDEIGDLPSELQGKLLLVSEHKILRRVGGNRNMSIDIRFIFATNKDLWAMSQNGNFRKDLLFRMSKRTLCIPPLRKRLQDLPLIARFYWNAHGHGQELIAKEMDALLEYSYPGNVRELVTILDNIILKSQGKSLSARARLIREDIARLREFEEKSIDTIDSKGDDEKATWRPHKILKDMSALKCSFWDVIYKPYLSRDLNKHQLAEIVSLAIKNSGGSFKKAIKGFGIEENKYKKFMDFLRHQKIRLDKTR
jgi:transcriptional regulator with GAF, ATPase, and Fis domain